jgi:uncharacterized protein (TIRG00374 family)
MFPRLRRYLLLSLPFLSVPAAAAIFISMYSPGRVLDAIESASLPLIVLAFLSGVLIETFKAGRASLMLSCCRPISVRETFGINVVSHGIGHLLPFAPATMALRSLLVNRMKGIPVFFSAGVFLAADVLDNSVLLPLLAYLLAMVPLPVWQRVLLVGVLVQSVVILVIPFLGGSFATLLTRVAGSRFPGWLQRVLEAVDGTASGMATVVRGGWKLAALVMLLTASSLLVGMLRFELFLHAFSLSADWTQLCWLMILASLVGRLPFPVPGAGVWATTKALKIAAIAGPGIGGYILVLRTISSIETPLLALGVLLWWGIFGNSSTIGWRDFRSVWRRAPHSGGAQDSRPSPRRPEPMVKTPEAPSVRTPGS